MAEWPIEVKTTFLRHKAAGLTPSQAMSKMMRNGDIDQLIPESTYRRWKQEKPSMGAARTTPVPVVDSGVVPKTLIFDIETLPNKGYFFDCYSDRGIPLQFIQESKAIVTLAYKWLGSSETHVLVAKEPYKDDDVLSAFLPELKKAQYVVGHYGDGFDIPFVSARLAANGLEAFPHVASVDTYKLAKKHFKTTLNSNKLDHLGEIFGVGNKNKTDASLWVKCAQGDKEALAEMARYNAQDVDLLEKVFLKLQPYVKTKINHNLFVDDVTRRCKACGSENLEHNGYEMTAASMKDRCKCNDCGAYSSFPMVKQ